MDYRDLLKKYLGLVMWHEGTYFLGFDKSHYRRRLTAAELAELTKLADEVDDDQRRER